MRKTLINARIDFMDLHWKLDNESKKNYIFLQINFWIWQSSWYQEIVEQYNKAS